MSLSGLTIFGMYIAPDKGLPARAPEAYTASAFSLDLSSQSVVCFEPEIQRYKIRHGLYLDERPIQSQKSLSMKTWAWRPLAGSSVSPYR